MTDPNGRLLGAADLAEAGPAEAVRLPLELIDPNPDNPRHYLAEIPELADSIAEFSLLQPITVRRLGDRYQLLSGHRRLAAFQLLRDREPHQVAWHSIPSVVRNSNDERAYLALITAQVHIASWHPKEQAAALERLALSGMTLEDIGTRLHRTGGWVSRRLRVFADSVLSGYVQTGKLAPSVAEELLPVLDASTKRTLAEQAVRERWSQDQVKGKVRSLRLDRQLGQVGKLTHQLLEILSSIDARDVPVSVTRDLWTLYGRIEVLAGGRAPRLPTIEEAQRTATIRDRPRLSGQKRKPGYKPKL